MNKLLLFLSCCLCLVSCGGDSASFPGVWAGSFSRINSDCPFPITANLDYLFPMTVNEEADGVFTVVAADGSEAIGSQGSGEEISFTAQADVFGDFGSILPYMCSSTARVGFLTKGSDKSSVTITYSFENCTSPGSSDVFHCSVTYFGDASSA